MTDANAMFYLAEDPGYKNWSIVYTLTVPIPSLEKEEGDRRRR